MPGVLVLGYIFDFISRQAALTTTSFDKKNRTRVYFWSCLGRQAHTWVRRPHVQSFVAENELGGNNCRNEISSAGKNRTVVDWKSGSGRR